MAPVVVCVVVTFNPDRPRFEALLTATRPQVDQIVLVDNGSAPQATRWLEALEGERLHRIDLRANLGIAAAQNAGISRAREIGATHVLLLDHDSIPADTMVARLLAAAVDLQRKGVLVAAVGPRYVDTRQDNPPPFIRVRGLALERRRCADPTDVVEVDYLIASGSLVPVATLASVGPMDEALFIDYVDIEWGLRAQGKGYRSWGVCAAAMDHDLGDTPITLFGRRYPHHSPLRHYYHFRNALALYRRPGIPGNWKVVDGWRLALKYVFYALLARPRLAHLSMMSRGIADGLRGRLGPYAAGRVTDRRETASR